jgi:hypothetical protein
MAEYTHRLMNKTSMPITPMTPATTHGKTGVTRMLCRSSVSEATAAILKQFPSGSRLQPRISSSA